MTHEERGNGKLAIVQDHKNQSNFMRNFDFCWERNLKKTFDATWSFQLNEKLEFGRVKDEVKGVHHSMSWPCQAPFLQMSNSVNMYDGWACASGQTPFWRS